MNMKLWLVCGWSLGTRQTVSTKRSHLHLYTETSHTGTQLAIQPGKGFLPLLMTYRCTCLRYSPFNYTFFPHCCIYILYLCINIMHLYMTLSDGWLPKEATLASNPSALMRPWSFCTSSFSSRINCGENEWQTGKEREREGKKERGREDGREGGRKR